MPKLIPTADTGTRAVPVGLTHVGSPPSTGLTAEAEVMVARVQGLVS